MLNQPKITPSSDKEWRNYYENRARTLRKENAALLHQRDALAEALTKLIRFTEELCEDVGVSKHYPSLDAARSALAAVEGEK
jgi:hypothetical protein